MPDTHSTYPVAIRWEGEKRGRASSADGLPELEVAAPPAFGGPPGLWSPEHLFVLSAASCWMTTFLAVAHASGLSPAGVDCPAEGTVIRGDDRRYRIATIALRPRVTVSDEALREKTLRLMAKAESACLISASMSATVTMEPEVVVSAQIAPGKPMV